jgi:beta-1,4-mannooligosaccharide/beta-1,4-mannosyl-N-acetylglucosamine phosphorylase
MQDQDTNRLVLYYGAADSYVGMAFGYVDQILDYIKKNSRLDPSDSDIGK